MVIKNLKGQGLVEKIASPHDKLFREIWSDIAAAKDFLANYLPAGILKLIDLNSLEIKKDTFIEKELEDYFADILYRVNLAGDTGYIYLLFEHKSWEEKWIHLQLLSYMLKIWQLHRKQGKGDKLPIIIPLVLYHGRQRWGVDVRFLECFYGPTEILSEYIPDFRYILYDLSRYSDEEIRGAVIPKVALLLFKYVFDPDFRNRLPYIFSLMRDLSHPKTGLQYLETLLRYLFSTLEDIDLLEIKGMVEKEITEEQGGFIMTLAEKLRNEGKEQGMQQGMQQGAKKLLCRLIARRFPVNLEDVQPIFTDLTAEQMEELGVRLFEAESLDDIKKWADEMRKK